MFDCDLPFRSTLPELVDVCVIGGGPAGSALALRLARLGRSVIVIEKATFPRKHIGEALTSGVVPLLRVLGVLPQMETCGIYTRDNSYHALGWSVELFGYARRTPGRQSVFDEILLRAARAAGALVMQPVRALDIAHGNNWSIQLDNGVIVQSRFLADTTGRWRILGGRKKISGSRTIAMYAYWSKAGADNGDTFAEAASSQWYWGAQLPDGYFNATVFVDKENARKGTLPSNLIGQSSLLAPRLAKADCGELCICDATSFVDEMPVTCCSIKAGDAALTIDPLSSQGVQTALGTAIHAAVVLNTVLDRPGQADLAMDFYSRRILESATFHARATGELYRKQNEFAPHSFWNERAKGHAPFEQHRKSSLASLEQRVQNLVARQFCSRGNCYRTVCDPD